MHAERCRKQLPRKCSVVMEKVDLSQYLVQDEHAEEPVVEIAMERTPKRKLLTKSGQNVGKKSRRASTAAMPKSPAISFEDDVAMYEEVLNSSIEVKHFSTIIRAEINLIVGIICKQLLL
jgi:hypothetical protein